MAQATYSATPPLLSKYENNKYKDWKRLVKCWTKICGIPKTEQASALLLSLEGKALDAALELPETDLDKDTGIDTLLARLDKLYVKDELSEKFSALESFACYKRPSNLSIRDFLQEFDKKHYRVKNHALTDEDLLGYRLIKAANLAPDKEQLVKATVTTLNYDVVKEKMLKIFSDDSKIPMSTDPVSVQEALHAQHKEQNSCDEPNSSDEEEAYYANRTKWNRNSRSKFPPRKPSGSSSSNWRANRDDNRADNSNNIRNKPKKTLDASGQITPCAICDSVNHWAPSCPDRPSQSQSQNLDKITFIVHEIVLYA